MKKFLIALVAMFATVNFLSAQNESINIAKPTDNWSVSVQTGYSTLLKDMFESKSSAQYIGVGFDKMITPYFGFGPELNVVITNGADNVLLINPNMNVKFNLANVFVYTGERHLFEPNFLVGLGYTIATQAYRDEHICPSARAGFDFEFNLGESKELAIMLSPRFYCADLNHFSDAILLELGVGLVYHF